MSKKPIIMTAAAGLVSFAGAFAFAWLTNPSLESEHDQLNQSTLTSGDTELELPEHETDMIGDVNAVPVAMKKTMTERQLKNLIHDVRGKMQEYNNKLQDLSNREQRLQMAQDVLKKDIEKLDNLRIELTSIIANIKSERDSLLKSRLEITQAEKTNLVSIAAFYDMMEVSSASKIMTNMCVMPDPNQAQGGGISKWGGSFDDVVKILYYMTERPKAKLLAELSTSEPTLAAALCKRLKQIVEGK